MPIENNKPPDPILEEFSTLTGMSSEGLSHKPFIPHDVLVPPRSRGRPKGTKNRAKSVKIKIQSPGSVSKDFYSIFMECPSKSWFEYLGIALIALKPFEKHNQGSSASDPEYYELRVVYGALRDRSTLRVHGLEMSLSYSFGKLSTPSEDLQLSIEWQILRDVHTLSILPSGQYIACQGCELVW
ncbi:hypothetical protein Tco_0635516 [Tanacetum coccineum]